MGLRINVTDLKRREQELERSRAEYQSLLERLEQEIAHFQSIVESSGALIVLVDRDLKVVMANREFWKSTGLEPHETIGRPLRDTIRSGLDAAVLERWLSGPLSTEQTKPVRYSKRRLDAEGRECFINITAKPIVDDERRVRQIVFLGVDDTERQEAERAGWWKPARLATLGEMAATVAHELAQPLQMINLSGTVALEEIDEARALGRVPDIDLLASKLVRIAEQVETTSRIPNDLRSYVRNTSGDQAALFDLAQALRTSADITHHAMELGGVETRVRVDGRLPMITGHSGKFEQVLINLLNNARDEGATLIELSAGVIRRDGHQLLRVAVEDNGPGIPAQILPKLFRSFVTTKPRGQRTRLSGFAFAAASSRRCRARSTPRTGLRAAPVSRSCFRSFQVPDFARHLVRLAWGRGLL